MLKKTINNSKAVLLLFEFSRLEVEMKRGCNTVVITGILPDSLGGPMTKLPAWATPRDDHAPGCPTTGGPRRRGDTSPSCVRPASQSPSHWNPDQLWARQEDWPETTQKLTPSPKTQDSKPRGELTSWTPLASDSLPGHPFPIKPHALSARVSPWTIHF